ncbi:MAG: hypothetical protein JWM41_3074 [Gemmatimonadetes bacterium]|nr:hypothetical protein [Gemmatimonadota bacterium]
MLFFRSEEHLDAWLAANKKPRGYVLSLEQTWRLSKAWYVDRREASWRPRAADEAQTVLDSVGLTDDFWRLKP